MSGKSCLRWLVLLGSLVAEVFAQSKHARNVAPPDPVGTPCPLHRAVEKEVRFDDYLIRTYRWPDPEGCLQIFKNGKLVYRAMSNRFEIGNDVNVEDHESLHLQHPAQIPVGTDLLGLGKPDLIVSEWTGGAHCCFTFHLFEVGERFRKIASLEAKDSDYSHLEDVDHDGRYEFISWDGTFAYWHASFGDSPAPAVILKFDGNRFRLAVGLMRKAPPSQRDQQQAIESIRRDSWHPEGTATHWVPADEYPPPALWGKVLDLLYTGNSATAWALIDDAWVPGHMPKEEFLRRFCGHLAKSPYFADLRPAIDKAPCTFNPRDDRNN